MKFLTKIKARAACTRAQINVGKSFKNIIITFVHHTLIKDNLYKSPAEYQFPSYNQVESFAANNKFACHRSWECHVEKKMALGKWRPRQNGVLGAILFPPRKDSNSNWVIYHWGKL